MNWIPTSERLPEAADRYLPVRLATGEERQGCCYDDGEERWWEVLRPDGYFDSSVESADVTHWCEIAPPSATGGGMRAVLLHGEPYPCTVTRDRYSGAYSQGQWLAWPCLASDVPTEPDGADGEAILFWGFDADTESPGGYDGFVGKGDTPAAAVRHLTQQMKVFAGRAGEGEPG